MRLDEAPHFLSADDLQAEIARFTYRPGWKMSVYRDSWEGSFLYVVADVIDGYHPEKTVQLRIRSMIPPMPTADAFAQWLLWRLIQIETHECCEMLRRDGSLVRDPHDVAEPG